MRYHDASNPPKEIEKPLRSPNLCELVDQWDADLVELTLDQLFELLMAASYLHLKPLADLVSAKLATVFKGKTPDQLRKTIGIVKDFTAEEEQAILNDHRLLEDA
jgi:S-phase kinase-associated protein 1